MKTIGMIGGMSWESSTTYYQLLNQGVRARLGGLHSAKLLLWSFDFAEIEAYQSSGNWADATAAMIEAATRLESAGAELLMICTNTMHLMADDIETAVSIPLMHIADATGDAVKRNGCTRPLLLGTRFTMEQDFYTGRLKERCGIEAMIPNDADRKIVDRIIYEELCMGHVRDASKRAYLDVIGRAIELGADGVILGCTEIGLLIGPDDIAVPVFDSTLIHAEAALEMALQ